MSVADRASRAVDIPSAVFDASVAAGCGRSKLLEISTIRAA
jgi:hypothetical protein